MVEISLFEHSNKAGYRCEISPAVDPVVFAGAPVL
ncbi:MAG: hypothetical protein ACJA0X_001201 [Cyclobacteriaceae bacterium]|jgi:hypothetical protein